MMGNKIDLVLEDSDHLQSELVENSHMQKMSEVTMLTESEDMCSRTSSELLWPHEVKIKLKWWQFVARYRRYRMPAVPPHTDHREGRGRCRTCRELQVQRVSRPFSKSGRILAKFNLTRKFIQKFIIIGPILIDLCLAEVRVIISTGSRSRLLNFTQWQFFNLHISKMAANRLTQI